MAGLARDWMSTSSKRLSASWETADQSGTLQKEGRMNRPLAKSPIRSLIAHGYVRNLPSEHVLVDAQVYESSNELDACTSE